MAIMQILSSNKNLSFVIKKNPQSGIFLKKIKMGMMFGYFPYESDVQNQNRYVIHFKDASDKISYKVHPDEQFEYLNSSKYNDARFINDAIQECLHSAREGKGVSAEYDVPAKHLIRINLVNTEYKTIDIFRRYFQDIEIRHDEVSKDNYAITFISEYPMSFQRIIMVVNLFGIFAQLNSPTYSYLTEDLIQKYIRIANEVDAPYFIKYLIKIRMCRSEKIFENNKADLERSERHTISMVYGDTHVARLNFIKNKLISPNGTDWKMNNSIIDIGTGIDYRYLKMFGEKIKEAGLMYYAIEIDFDARMRIQAGLKNRGWEDCVVIFESLADFMVYHNEYLTKESFDVICTEVLEHNEFEDAKKIVRTVLRKIKINNFIITLPNKSFNTFYAIDGMRHDDHKWEATVQDLHSLSALADGSGIGRHLEPVGDIVDGLPVTWAISFFK